MRTSPILAKWLANWTELINFSPVSRLERDPAPLTPNENTDPGPSGKYFLARALCGWLASPEYLTQSMRESLSNHSATAWALMTCSRMRCAKVSTPCTNINADIGLNAAPISRSCSTRTLVRNPNSPKLSHHETPPYEGTGSVIVGNLPLPQLNFPDSTITPPKVVPWPPKNFVAECRTISAPYSIGRTK